MTRITVLIALAILLSGCGSLFDRITAQDINSPAPLVAFDAAKTMTSLWRVRIGGKSDAPQPELIPAVVQGIVYAAAADGQVRALDRMTGATAWSVDMQTPLTAGVGVGAGRVVLGTPEGEVIVLSAQDGTEQWRAAVSSEVRARPVVAQDRIVITAADGSVSGFDPDGALQWRFTVHMPDLGLQGMSTPVVQGNQLLHSTTQGQLIARDLATGRLLWHITIAIPSGRSVVQQLIDSDTDPLVHQGLIYAATYQGGLIALDYMTGALRWQQPFSTYRNLVADSNTLYAVGEDSSLWAFVADTGALHWRQTDLLQHRAVSDPLVMADVLALGDLDGYVHLLSIADGQPVARQRVGRAAISTGLVHMEDILYVQDAAGYLSALRISD